MSSEQLRIIVLEGDETGQELLEQALRVLEPDVLKVDLELEHFDLSLENRRETSNEVGGPWLSGSTAAGGVALTTGGRAPFGPIA